MNLTNKVAIVTGAGRGIGKAIAIAYAADGAYVVITSRSQDQLSEVADEIKAKGGNVLASTN